MGDGGDTCTCHNTAGSQPAPHDLSSMRTSGTPLWCTEAVLCINPTCPLMKSPAEAPDSVIMREFSCFTDLSRLSAMSGIVKNTRVTKKHYDNPITSKAYHTKSSSV